MTWAFYLAATIALASTILAISRSNAVHGLLYFVVSLLSVAVALLAVGAVFAAVFEVMIYAGAIMVLFVFVVMMITLGPFGVKEQQRWVPLKSWLGPAILTAILTFEAIYLQVFGKGGSVHSVIDPKDVAVTLLGPYVLALEVVSMLLLVGLVGAFHLAHDLRKRETHDAEDHSGSAGLDATKKEA